MKTLLNTKLRQIRTVLMVIITTSILFSCNDDDNGVDSAITSDFQNENPEAKVDVSIIKDSDNFSESLELEFYNITNSSNSNRPLVLLASGGAFREHNEIEKMQEYAMSLAKRGYAAAVVKYSINGIGNTADIWIRALHDMRTSIRFFKHNSDNYNIDPENIFTYGWSTGAQLGFYASFLSKEEYDAFEQEYLKGYIQQGLDEHGWDSDAFPNESSSVKATIMCMPYMFDEQIISADDPALMLIANEAQKFSNGDTIMGRLSSAGIWNLGPDLMRIQALGEGYNEGENLQVDIIKNIDIPSTMTNESSIYQEYYDFENVVQFIYSNL